MQENFHITVDNGNVHCAKVSLCLLPFVRQLHDGIPAHCICFKSVSRSHVRAATTQSQYPTGQHSYEAQFPENRGWATPFGKKCLCVSIDFICTQPVTACSVICAKLCEVHCIADEVGIFLNDGFSFQKPAIFIFLLNVFLHSCWN